MATADEKGGIPDMVTFTEIAKRVTARELVTRPITRQGVRHIADTDPGWPIPREQWQKIGSAWAMPWGPIETFFRERTTRGRGPDTQPRRPKAPSADE
jgi:hypothetical protein